MINNIINYIKKIRENKRIQEEIIKEDKKI